MNFNRAVLVALIACVPLHSIAPAVSSSSLSRISFIEGQYKQIKRDLHIVKKCYLSNGQCTEQERVQARNAALRLTGETALLLAVIGGLSYLAYKKVPKVRNWYGNKPDNQPQQPDQPQQPPQQPVGPINPDQPNAQPDKPSQPAPVPVAPAEYQPANDLEKLVIEKMKADNIKVDQQQVNKIVNLAGLGETNLKAWINKEKYALKNLWRGVKDATQYLDEELRNELLNLDTSLVAERLKEKILQNEIALALAPRIEQLRYSEYIRLQREEKRRQQAAFNALPEDEKFIRNKLTERSYERLKQYLNANVPVPYIYEQLGRPISMQDQMPESLMQKVRRIAAMSEADIKNNRGIFAGNSPNYVIMNNALKSDNLYRHLSQQSESMLLHRDIYDLALELKQDQTN